MFEIENHEKDILFQTKTVPYVRENITSLDAYAGFSVFCSRSADKFGF